MTQTKSAYYYDEEAAQRAIDFFECVLVYPTTGVYAKGGDPFLLEPYQKEFLSGSLGWYDLATESGYPELKHIFCYFEVPKGHGKTPMMAGLALLKAGWSGITDGEIYLLAGTRKQAAKMLRDCKLMITKAGLSSFFDCQSHIIRHIKSGTTIEAVSSEAGGSEGMRPDLVIMDESHIQPNDVLFNTFAEGMDKKPSAQFFIITTAGIINTFGHELHNYAVDVQNGIIINPAWYVKIYAAPPSTSDEDCLKEETWFACNPGLGTVKSIAKLRKFALEAAQRASKLNSFKRYHLNMWVSSLVEWIGLDDFRKCNKGKIDLEYHKKNRTPCYCGLDLASTEDMSAFCMLFVEEDSAGKLISADWVNFCWVPSERVQKKEKTENLNYPEWVKKNYIFTTPGDQQDKDMILDFVEDMNATYNIKLVNVDTSYHRSVIGARAETSKVNYLAHSQGMQAMSTPTKEARILLGGQKINYAGNPVLEWQITNAEAWTDSNENTKLMKGTGTGKGAGRVKKKIDCIVAFVMAVSGHMSKPEAETKGIAQKFW